MLAYRGVAQSTMVVVSALARSAWPAVHAGGQGSVVGINVSVPLQLLYSELVNSACKF